MRADRTSLTRPGRVARRTLADRADRHKLYERAVQDADAELDFVTTEFRRLRGRAARELREDFCGTAAVAANWAARHRLNRAVGVDLDAEVLAWGETHNASRLTRTARTRLELRRANVLTVRTPPQDVILAMNFSYWIFKTRDLLREYFRRVRRALKPDGVFILDCFGGFDSFRVLQEKRPLRGFTYVWDQASYNPVNGDFVCHIHFRFPDGSRLQNAFTYEWRLWTLPEIREILAEAGFSRSIVYWQGWDERTQEGNGVFEPVESADADAGWIAYVAVLK